MKVSNEVPPETIIKHMAREKGELLAYIDELEDKVKRRDEAIAAFKKWQSKVAEYKWQYWLQEGIQLMETPPDNKMLRVLIKLLEANRIFENWQRKVVSAWESYKKAQENFRNTLESQGNQEQLNKGQNETEN